LGTFASIMARGGPVMWPLLLCSLVSLTVIVERALFWARQRRDPEVVGELFRLTEEGRFQEAAARGEGSRDATARVLLAGLRSRRHGLTEGMEVAAAEEVDRQKRGLGVLDTIVTLAPLLGIFGTVTGIIQAFDFLSLRGVPDPKAVTSGIAEALITTAAGLSVALMTLIPYNAFVHRVERSAQRLAQVGTQFEMAYREGREREG
jgi:biopolymer transport protein ExbB